MHAEAPRHVVQSEVVRCRVSPVLLERIEAKATREGVPLSELVRSAIRRELADVA